MDSVELMAVLGDATQAVRRERELRQSQAWIHTIVTGLTDYAPGQVPPATDPLPEDASEAADRAQRGLLEEDGNA